MIEWLRDRWAQHVANWRDVDWTWDILTTLYCAPHRHYHTLDHVASCIRVADTIRDERINRTSLDLAIFWHDAVYFTDFAGGPYNECRSAALFRGIAPWLIGRFSTEEVESAIMATAHGSPDHPDSATIDAVLDCDLSILASESSAYDRYVEGVRQEYRHVSDEAWRVGRRGVLEGFLGRPAIYRLPEMQPLEGLARVNIKRELADLGGTP